MEHTKTHRGFALIEFTDRYGAKCSLQKSSLATEDAIWLGPDDADPKQLVPGEGWQPVALPENINMTTRMHLTREQVAELLPVLNHFVDTGELPQPEAK